LKRKCEEETNDYLKALEYGTKESQHEMDVLDAPEELKDLNIRNGHVDYWQLLSSMRGWNKKGRKQKMRLS